VSQRFASARNAVLRPRPAVSAFTERTRPIRVGIVSAFAGGATLAGEVLGARLLRPVVGGAAVAQAGAVAGILGGLGVGAWIAGRMLTSRRVAPRRLIDACLALLVVLTVIAPRVARAMSGPSARMLVSLGERHPSIEALVGAVVAAVATLPFGLASGAIYPAIAQLHGRGVGRATALAGATSSLGSALAVLGVTFIVAPALGVRDGLYCAAVLYVLAGIAARTFDPADPGPPSDATESTASSRAAIDAERWRAAKRAARGKARDDALEPKIARRVVLLAIGCVGFASIAWQLGLARLGVLAFGPSAFSLAAATAAHTLSLAAGEWIAGRSADEVRQPRRRFVQTLVVAVVGATVVFALAAHLPSWSARAIPGSVRSMTTLWSVAIGLITALMVPVVALVGASIPLAARMFANADAGATARRADANAGVLGAMAIGNVVASFAVPLAVIPTFGVRGALLSATLMLFAAATALALSHGGARTRALPVLGIAVLVVGASVYGWRRWDPAMLSQGPFLYAGSDVELGRIVSYREGREATVVVRLDDAGTFLLQIDGKIDATSTNDSATQILVGLVPAVLAAHPRDVLVIGIGSGMTVDAVRSVPGVRNVVATELLPEVIDAARTYFAASNHHALDAANVRVLREDASLFVRGTRATFDVIVSEPSNPWVAGMADLFTVEAIRAAADRLRPGGTMAMWFHAHSTDAATFASIVATFRAVFQRAGLFEMVPGQDYMIVGMRSPVRVDMDRVAGTLAEPGVLAQFARAGIADRGTFMGRFVAGTDGTAAIATAGSVLHAEDLRLEFRAPLLLYSDATAEIFALFGRSQDLPLAGLGAFGSLHSTLIDESEGTREAALHGRQMTLAFNARDYDLALREGEQAVAAAPRDIALRGTLARIYIRRAGRRYRTRDPGGAEDDLHSALEIAPGGAERFRANIVLGDMALARDDYATTAQRYGSALLIAQETSALVPELHVRMAQVLRRLGDNRNARAELDRAIRQSTNPHRIAEIRELRDSLPMR